MHTLQGKKVLLGITGGIAAYKSIQLVRLFRQYQVEVQVVLTASAQEFVTPLTLQAISGHPIHSDLLDPHAEAAMGHIELAKWADLVLVAPASANTLAKLAHGFADDLLSTIILATSAPIFIAPAMNQQMFKQTITQANLQQLIQRGVKVIGPDHGDQACGDHGPGRMSEPESIVNEILAFIQPKILDGLTLTITAGPTREALDPVRYLSNHSSGKMGFALAQAAQTLGATVFLVSGPVALNTPNNVQRIDVQSAQQMYDESLLLAIKSDIFIACAAVADYRPEQQQQQKIKKDHATLSMNLIKNPDILYSIGHLHESRPFTVGFAAETEHMVEHARQKCLRKKADLICANQVGISTGGFNSDHNQVTLISANEQHDLPHTSKQQLAYLILNYIKEKYQSYETSHCPKNS